MKHAYKLVSNQRYQMNPKSTLIYTPIHDEIECGSIQK